MSITNPHTRFEKCVNLLLPLTPILELYGWLPFEFSFIATLILLIYSLFIHPKAQKVPQLLSIYLWYYLFAFLFGGIISGTLSLPLGWLKIFVTYVFFFKFIKFKLLTKYYTIIVYICIAYLYLQTILINIAGIKITGVAYWLPIAIDTMDASSYIDATLRDNWRECSFFSEPAKFAQFLLPFFTFSLFIKHKFRVLNLILAVSSLLLLRSGNALLIVGIIVLCYIFHIFFSKWNLKKICILIVTIGGIIIAGSYYMSSEYASGLMERQDEISGTDYYSSGFIRIFRGYYVFESLPMIEKIIGANNIPLIDQAISKCSVAFLFDYQDHYFNTVQNILIKTGIIGAIIFMLLLFTLFKKNNPAGKTIIISIVAVSFIASMYLSYLMLLYLIFAQRIKQYTLNEKKRCNINYSRRD